MVVLGSPEDWYLASTTHWCPMLCPHEEQSQVHSAALP